MAVFRIRNGGRLAVLLVAGLMAALSLSSCSDEDSQQGPGPVGPVGPVGEEMGIAGSGTVVTETRDVSGFDRVAFASEGAAFIEIGGGEALSVEVDDNLQQYLEASVDGGVLTIGTRAGVDIAPSEAPVFRVNVENLTGVSLAGAGTIDVGAIETERFEIGLSGAGDITIASLAVDELVAELDGVGKVMVSGSADRQELHVRGVTVYEGEDLASQSAVVEAGGTGRATVWVSESIQVTASGTASVGYYGTPSVNEQLSASATASALGPK